MSDVITSCPLVWASIYPRTPFSQKQPGQFKVNFAIARDGLFSELERLRAKDIVLSTNIPLRKDGIPYANFKEPEDSGVAVYFSLKSKKYVLCCDRYFKVKDNIRAIGLHISALRGMERWGVGSLEQAFYGYLSLPSSDHKQWFEVLGVSPSDPPEKIKQSYRDLSKILHPDGGGSESKFLELTRAYEEYKNQGV